MGRSPPERFHVFVSYTTREDEVRAIRPIVNEFLKSVLRPLIKASLGEPPVFYDAYSLYNPMGAAVRHPDYELRRAIRFAVEESEVLLAFLSPSYPTSTWCALECETMAKKAPRPWFDVCRTPPIDELRDQRLPPRRPTWWGCLRARWMRITSRTGRPASVPDELARPIVPIVWKVEPAPRRRPSSPAAILRRLPSLSGRPYFDWRACVRAAEAARRVAAHDWEHGSVSPAWETEAEALGHECREVMAKTAATVERILLQRRVVYSRGRS